MATRESITNGGRILPNSSTEIQLSWWSSTAPEESRDPFHLEHLVPVLDLSDLGSLLRYLKGSPQKSR